MSEKESTIDVCWIFLRVGIFVMDTMDTGPEDDRELEEKKSYFG